MSAPDSAAKTLDVLRREGWAKGVFNSREPTPHCLYGAMVRAGLTNSESMRLATALRRRIAAEFPERVADGGGVMEFNDDPDTTFADVEMVLEKVIAS